MAGNNYMTLELSQCPVTPIAARKVIVIHVVIIQLQLCTNTQIIVYTIFSLLKY